MFYTIRIFIYFFLQISVKVKCQVSDSTKIFVIKISLIIYLLKKGIRQNNKIYIWQSSFCGIPPLIDLRI